ncbi:general amidase-like protein [Pyronema domesticum]|nr:general amidase-like protein [Pyronema domesticum]
MSSPPETWREISIRARANRDSKIPPSWLLKNPTTYSHLSDVTSVPRSCGLLTPLELDITESYTAPALVSAISEKKFTAVEVATAFCKRAAIAQQLVNCLTEIFFDEAIERARYLDKYLEENGKPIGPLHGLPISLKDCFSLPSHPSSVGFSLRAFLPDTTPATLPTLLLSSGAVLYVKTTTPQGQLSLDTHSYLWGRTLNPHSRFLTAGGSSGGEAALVAMRGSLLGIGTDMGGSIRIPALCCGLFGFKPTSTMMPKEGTETCELPGGRAAGLPVSVGPIAATAEECKWFMKIMEGREPWRVDAGVVPWRLQIPVKRQLKVGVLKSNGVTGLLPPYQSVMEEVEAALCSAGHQVIPITIPEYPKAFATAVGFMTLLGNRHVYNLLEAAGREPLSPWLKDRMKPKGPKERGLEEMVRLSHDKQQVEQKMLKELWDWEGRSETKDSQEVVGGVDIILCPVAGHPTPGHDNWAGVDWTAVWNLLDWPVGVVPVRKVRRGELEMELGGKSVGRQDDACRKLWDPEVRQVFEGAPMGVQVVGRKGMDGDVLEAMERVAEAVRNIPRTQERKRESKI